MGTILAIPGSWRKGSYNAALARAAQALAPDGWAIEIASIADFPLYDGDLEAAQGLPSAVAALKERIVAADALLLVTPEYNNSVPGTLKNAIDWLTRPASDIARVFGDKPTGLIGATPGPGGTRLAQAAWLPVLRLLGTRPWFGKSLYLADAGEAFDAGGALVDERLRGVLAAYLQGFAAFAARR